MNMNKKLSIIKKIGQVLSAVILVAALFIMSGDSQRASESEYYEVMISQVSFLNKEYALLMTNYDELTSQYFILQKNNYDIIETNLSLASNLLFQEKENIELKDKISLVEQERDALKSSKYNLSFSSKERLWLSQLLYVETHGESLTGQLAVIQVVMNRVAHSDFPNSIEDVITQSGQFTGYASSKWGEVSTETDYAVFAYVDLGLRATQIDNDILFFYSYPTTNFLKSLTVDIQIGGHYFCAN